MQQLILIISKNLRKENENKNKKRINRYARPVLINDHICRKCSDFLFHRIYPFMSHKVETVVPFRAT